jgi:Zn-dependent membrane protease YugP
MLMVSPFSAMVTRSRALAVMLFLSGMATLLSGVLVHLLTLPTELDASFRRALPLIEDRAVLRREDLPHARKLLAAAALTYVAVALQSLLNIARWWALLRRGV